MKVVKTEQKGRGVITTRPFQKGDFICSYSGELVTAKEAKEREKRYSKIARCGNYTSSSSSTMKNLIGMTCYTKSETISSQLMCTALMPPKMMDHLGDSSTTAKRMLILNLAAPRSTQYHFSILSLSKTLVLEKSCSMIIKIIIHSLFPWLNS